MYSTYIYLYIFFWLLIPINICKEYTVLYLKYQKNINAVYYCNDGNDLDLWRLQLLITITYIVR